MLLLVLACPVHAEEAARASETGADAATELSRQATDPTASLQYNFIRDDGLEAWKLTFSITVLLPAK